MGQGFGGWLSPGGTGYPCRCGKLNGGFPRRHWLFLPLWKTQWGLSPAALARPATAFTRRGAVSCRACFACRINAFLPPIPPDPLPQRGRGRPKLFFARGFAPCIPSIRPPAALVRPAVSAPSGAGFAPCFPCRLGSSPGCRGRSPRRNKLKSPPSPPGKGVGGIGGKNKAKGRVSRQPTGCAPLPSPSPQKTSPIPPGSWHIVQRVYGKYGKSAET